MKQYAVGMFMFLLLGSAANAALLSRSGGQSYYDTVLDITWVADANLAKTSGYDTDGKMTWDAAQTWIDTLNAASYLGANKWRLPALTDTGPPGCDRAYSGTDCGFNVDLSTSKLARLYSTLGNTGLYNTGGVATGGPCLVGPNYCLTNTGPFSNLQPYHYWSGTEYAPGPISAWSVSFSDGYQHEWAKANQFFAWAVRPGDIALVPVPGAAWLFGGALGLLGIARRRKAT